jgi:CHASE3 domain sensor protein
MSSVRTRVFAGFGVCIALIVLAGVLGVSAIGQSQIKMQRIMQTIPSARETRDSVFQIVALQSALRGYLVTNDKSFLVETDIARQQLDTDYTALEIYSHNHPIFKHWLDEAMPLKDAIESALDIDLGAAQHGRHAAAVAGLIPLKRLVEQYQAVGPYIDDGAIGTPQIFRVQFEDAVVAGDQASRTITWLTVLVVVLVITLALLVGNVLATPSPGETRPGATPPGSWAG